MSSAISPLSSIDRPYTRQSWVEAAHDMFSTRGQLLLRRRPCYCLLAWDSWSLSVTSQFCIHSVLTVLTHRSVVASLTCTCTHDMHFISSKFWSVLLATIISFIWHVSKRHRLLSSQLIACFIKYQCMLKTLSHSCCHPVNLFAIIEHLNFC